MVGAAQVYSMLTDGRELALLDVRETGIFTGAHILAARSAPLSRLELLIDDLVPRKSTRIVVCDAGSGLAMRAAGKLGDFGYSDVAILDGGIDAWKGAGYVLFSGFNVPSKAFGEFVEHHYETPNISAADLHAMIESGEDMVVLDSRPLDEYQRMSIPTGIDVPGAELAYRVHDLAPDPQTTVVVNCAGRTRSIIGAQSLINAGIPNKVLALTNGTMGWVLAGYTCDKGSKNIAPPPGEEGLARAQEAAARVKKRFGVRAANWAEVAEWRQDPMRTLYLLDVRTVEEFEAGHPVGAIHAPGGQLVQGTDSFIGTLNARIVLYDPTGIRNALSASWLIQMNWHDVYVLDGGVEGSDFIQGPHTPFVPGLDEAKCQEIDAAALKALIDGGDTVVMDLADSKTYGAGHIPGAWFAVRSRLDIALAALPPHATLVLTSEDGRLARLVAGEAAAASPANLLMLAGGTKAWADAGNPLSEGPEKMADEADDVFLKAYDGPKGGPEAMQAYIDWETDLPRLIKMDGTS
ncbi:MAG: thiosulfate sulfurtransferase, partial [Rhodospirillales bacterium]|nr:thiosulfate sulfurtransferase [Rhodospirillales bacterium]